MGLWLEFGRNGLLAVFRQGGVDATSVQLAGDHTILASSRQFGTWVGKLVEL